MESSGFDRHDHGACISDAIAHADAYCHEAGLQLTPVRRRVLEILLRQHKALGAYEILDELRSEGFGSQPPVAYRALDFLVKHGFAHKIERLNAFSACTHTHPDARARHDPIFLICTECGTVAEASCSATDGGPLAEAAARSGFVVQRAVIEAEGLCPGCQTKAS